MSHTDRVIVLVDMDCFYCQVEEKLNPALEGKPIAVVQYNAWRGGGIIAVNYPARDKGVTRGMRGDEAKKKCPDIMLPRVPQVRGKADLTKYRDAGKKVADVLQTFTQLLERASVDEAYLDITEQVNKRLEIIADEISMDKLPNTFVVGFETKDFVENLKRNELEESDIKLVIGGIITEEIRAKVLEQTGYKCSAGIAHNKILAKLVCGLHKPNKQTILPQGSVLHLYGNLPIGKIKSLGGKLGNTIAEELQISCMGDLINFSEKELIKKFDAKTGKWLYNIARGIDLEPVTTRLISKSIGCCKQFPGKNTLKTSESVEHWMNELADEISERLVKDLEENNRKARQMVVSFTQKLNNDFVNSSRNHPLPSYDKAKIAQGAMDVLRRFCLKADGSYCLTYLGINVGNFQDLKNSKNIKSLFQNMQTTQNGIGNKEEHTKSQVKQKQGSSLKKYLGEREININSPKEENEKKSTTQTEVVSKADHLKPVKQKSSFFERYLRERETENTNSSKVEKSKTDNSEEVEDQDGLEDLHTSAYSAATDDLNEDQKNLIYFEDVFSQTDSKQAIFRNSDMIEQPTSQIFNSRNEGKRTTQSFFLNYLKAESKVVDEEMISDEDTENKDTVQEPARIYQVEKVVPCTSKLEVCDRQVCPECNKTILNEAFLSHLDYHFALKMVKEEAHLYKNPKNSNNTPNKISKEVKINKKSMTKRKISETITKPETKPILTFFNQIDESELNENNSDLCNECNKRVKHEDIISHMDYHTAKKLHNELNSNLKISKNGTPSTLISAKDKKSKTVKNVRTISTFFKSGS